MVKYIFQQWKEILSEHLSSVYLANLDGTTDFVTKKRRKNIEFYCDHEEADTKMSLILSFFQTQFS